MVRTRTSSISVAKSDARCWGVVVESQEYLSRGSKIVKVLNRAGALMAERCHTSHGYQIVFHNASAPDSKRREDCQVKMTRTRRTGSADLVGLLRSRTASRPYLRNAADKRRRVPGGPLLYLAWFSGI